MSKAALRRTSLVDGKYTPTHLQIHQIHCVFDRETNTQNTQRWCILPFSLQIFVVARMVGEDRWARRRAERDEADEGGPDEAGSRQADGQADGQTGRHTGRETNRQIDRRAK